MLFDLCPKKYKEDLFDRERELKEIKGSVKNFHLTIISGPRQVGKSSLLLSLMNEEKSHKWIYLGRLYNGSSRSLKERILQVLNKEGILSINKSREGIDKILSDLNKFGEDNNVLVIFAIDEAQDIKYLSGEDLYILAHITRYEHLRVIMAGVGWDLYEVMISSFKDRTSPFYGGLFNVIPITPFDEGTAMAFLIRGFSEIGMNIERDEAKRIIQELGTVPGFLVYFGKMCMSGKSVDEAIREVKAWIYHYLSSWLPTHKYEKIVLETLYNLPRYIHL